MEKGLESYSTTSSSWPQQGRGWKVELHFTVYQQVLLDATAIDMEIVKNSKWNDILIQQKRISARRIPWSQT